MRSLVLLGLALVASVAADVSIPKSYHDEVGIPEAQRIKAYEESIMSNPDTRPPTALGRIVGGSAAPINAHPYLGGLVISLVNVAGNSVCGSSLVSPNRLLTAAHCWFDGTRQAWQFIVVLGSQFLFQGGNRIGTSNVVMHPQYNFRMLFNDIAVIYLPSRVTFTSAIQAVSLPNSWELTESFVGDWAVAAGYGRVSDTQAGVTINTLVSHVNLQVISMAECQSVFSSNIIASTLCTSGRGGVGVCGGDSGGPLVVNRWGRIILVGVSSFAAQIGGMSACERGFPSGFARVTSFDNFIRQHL
ncbi:hypothetical protein O3G_MSEX002363 [Manduca sexta]|uniref:Peptidase S1 domain-containing protein n=1 Tax=Manduca sexta TaxID=7130 RepID=A0A921YN98_MANSE|nr:hypothetical protein O3G_MSEX002363 [Manduca sexta]KAG6442448.1 hypothetical protein O3G_MSEX002363 [Manduca sexta]